MARTKQSVIRVLAALAEHGFRDGVAAGCADPDRPCPTDWSEVWKRVRAKTWDPACPVPSPLTSAIPSILPTSEGRAGPGHPRIHGS